MNITLYTKCVLPRQIHTVVSLVFPNVSRDEVDCIVNLCSYEKRGSLARWDLTLVASQSSWITFSMYEDFITGMDIFC
jgi:hypothetical protein